MSPDYSLQPFSDDPTRSSLPTSADEVAQSGRSTFRTSVIQLDRPGDRL